MIQQHIFHKLQELTNEFKGQFECLGENIKKHKTFSVPIEKEVRKIYKGDNEITKITIFLITEFINISKFMASLLSNLINNFAE